MDVKEIKEAYAEAQEAKAFLIRSDHYRFLLTALEETVKYEILHKIRTGDLGR